MSQPENPVSNPRLGRRRAVPLTPSELVRSQTLLPDSTLPLIIRPAIEGINLLDWADHQRDMIEALLLKHGGLLFRGFPISGAEHFDRFMATGVGHLLEYRERSSPRSQVAGNIYTSTDHPPDQSIFLHNENSYSHTWPLRIGFHCITAAQHGGETPIADCRRIFQLIDPAIRARFQEKKILYVRNFGDGLGLPWQTVFQTENTAIVEEYCRKASIRFEWKDGGRLRTYKVGRAIAKHPSTGEMIWFNHATFFHVSTLPPDIRDGLLSTLGEEHLPTNTYYGDGSPIEPEVLEQLRTIYHEETVSFPWEEGDVLVLDNMLVAHGRAPYVGARKVVVAMALPLSEDKVEEG